YLRVTILPYTTLFRSRGGKISRMLVGTTKKLPYTIRLVAHGTSGHGSRPLPDNAIARLSNAISRIASWEPPMREIAFESRAIARWEGHTPELQSLTYL